LALQKTFFKVVGMYCVSCKPIVEKQLKDEKGVKSVKFDYLILLGSTDLFKGKFEPISEEFDPAVLTKEDIKNSLDKSGYKFVRLGNRGF